MAANISRSSSTLVTEAARERSHVVFLSGISLMCKQFIRMSHNAKPVFANECSERPHPGTSFAAKQSSSGRSERA